MKCKNTYYKVSYEDLNKVYQIVPKKRSLTMKCKICCSKMHEIATDVYACPRCLLIVRAIDGAIICQPEVDEAVEYTIENEIRFR